MIDPTDYLNDPDDEHEARLARHLFVVLRQLYLHGTVNGDRFIAPAAIGRAFLAAYQAWDALVIQRDA